MNESELLIDRWADAQSPNLRQFVRGAALSLLSGAYVATGRMARGLARPRVHFLCLHHVFADEESGFRRLLAHLAARCRFVSYSDAVARVQEGRIDDACVALSFDDGMKNCLRAARVMDEFGVRACFFILPSVVGEKDPARLREFCERGLQYPPLEFLDWDEVGSLLAQGHEIGSHTDTHSCVARLSRQQMTDEIFGSREAIESRVGPIRHFAWPFGHFEQFHPRAARLVFEAGYHSCASDVRGCHVVAAADPRQLCIRRENTLAHWPLRHIDYFLARSALAAGERDNHWPDGWNVAAEEGESCGS